MVIYSFKANPDLGRPLGLPDCPFFQPLPVIPPTSFSLFFGCFTTFVVLAAAKLITPLFEGYVFVIKTKGKVLPFYYIGKKTTRNPYLRVLHACKC